MSATAVKTNGNGSRPSLDDYIDVAQRIAEFNAKYPQGSLQTIDWEIITVSDLTFVVYRAAAYRTPDDTRPGHGTAWEPFPGTTPYTRNSELMNAETAAWGRAIVACGLAANRKIASLEEVRNRQPAPTSPSPSTATAAKPAGSERPATANQRKMLRAKARAAKLTDAQFANALKGAWGDPPGNWPDEAAAKRFLDRALDRLPARFVDAAIAQIDNTGSRS